MAQAKKKNSAASKAALKFEQITEKIQKDITGVKERIQAAQKKARATTERAAKTVTEANKRAALNAKKDIDKLTKSLNNLRVKEQVGKLRQATELVEVRIKSVEAAIVAYAKAAIKSGGTAPKVKPAAKKTAVAVKTASKKVAPKKAAKSKKAVAPKAVAAKKTAKKAATSKAATKKAAVKSAAPAKTKAKPAVKATAKPANAVVGS